ncbi:MAG: DUF58 domain-containing protein, partial [Myxococcaceae bacterium]|nr:DUF58 domain-containing protein [Myxococcaceae bacterium]
SDLWVFSGGVALLASALVVGLAFRPRLELERRPLPPVSVGDVVAYRVRVANRGRRTARLVSVAERRLPVDLRPHGAPPVIDALAPGEVREVTLRLECVGRGAHTLTRLQAASAFPSGLVRLGAASSRADRLVVYPRPLELPGLEVPLGRNLQPGGVAVASKVGDSPELLGTREWRDGDRLRDVHWAASARTGRWVVREFQEEYFVRLALVLDVEARSRREDARLERSLSFAAGLAGALARRDTIIDVVAAGDTVFRCQAGRALASAEQVLEVLTAIEPAPRFDAAALEAQLVPDAPKLSGVVFLAMRWDAARAGLAGALRARGVALRVVSLRGEPRPAGVAPEEWVTP